VLGKVSALFGHPLGDELKDANGLIPGVENGRGTIHFHGHGGLSQPPRTILFALSKGFSPPSLPLQPLPEGKFPKSFIRMENSSAEGERFHSDNNEIILAVAVDLHYKPKRVIISHQQQ
jgi:hypothetical protein